MSKPFSPDDKKRKQERAHYVLQQVKNEGNGDPALQHELAIFMCNGGRKGYLPYDIQGSFHWFTKASEQGYQLSQVALSAFYSLGMAGQKIDLQRAYDLCLQPSLDGNESAIDICKLLYPKLYPENEEEEEHDGT
jgi:TPR repeat protein